MKLTIWTGRPGSGMRDKVYRQAAQALLQGKDALILVPEQFTLEGESLLIRALERPGFLGQPVMSPTRLAREVFGRAGRAMPEAMDERGRAMALQRVAGQLASRLPLLGRSARNARFAGELSQLMGDMKRFDITAEALRQAGSHGSELLARKSWEVAELYGAFNDFLAQQGLWDGEDRFNGLIEALPQAEWLAGTKVWIDGFDQYPPQWLRLIEALCRRTLEVTVTVTTAETGAADAEVFLTGEMDLERLTERAVQAGIPVSRTHFKGAARTSLEQLPQQLFAYPGETVADDGRVRVMEAADEEREVEAASALADTLVREGARFKDIVVACADLPGLGPRVRRIFQRCGLPVFLDNRMALLEHPLVGLVLCCLEVAAKRWRREDVLRVIKNPLLAVNQSQQEAFEIYAEAFDLKGPRRFGQPFTRPCGEVDLEEAEQARQRLAGPLQHLRRSGTTEQWVRALEQMMESWGMERALEEYAALCEQHGDGEAAAQSRQAMEEMRTLLRQLVFLLPGEQLAAVELERLLEAGFGASQVGILPTRGDAVLVGDVGRTKVSEARHLILVGAQEGRLPMPHGEGALFHDRDLAALNDAGLPLGRDGRVRGAQSKLAVVDAIARASESLHVLYARTDEGGSALNPSPVVLRICRLMGLEAEQASPWAARSLNALKPVVARALGQLAMGRQAPGPWRPALASIRASEQGGPWVERLLGGRREEPVGEIRVRSLSVSRLEEYARCPMAWFIRYGLNPAQWPRFTADAQTIGSFTHEAMAMLGQQPGALSSEEAAEEAMDQITRDLKEKWFASTLEDTALGDYLFDVMSQACRRTACATARQIAGGSFRPAALELELPREASIPLKGGGELRLTGIIDRVDEAGQGWLRVIDYKTGKKALKPEGVLDGTQLQLWIYLHALLQQDKNRRPAGLYYSPARDELAQGDPMLDDRPQGITVNDPQVAEASDPMAGPGEESRIIGFRRNKDGAIAGGWSERDVRNLCRLAAETAARLGEAMCRGEIGARPAAQACEYCQYSAFCQRQIDPPAPAARPDKGAVRAALDGGKEEDHAEVD